MPLALLCVKLRRLQMVLLIWLTVVCSTTRDLPCRTFWVARSLSIWLLDLWRSAGVPMTQPFSSYQSRVVAMSLRGVCRDVMSSIAGSAVPTVLLLVHAVAVSVAAGVAPAAVQNTCAGLDVMRDGLTRNSAADSRCPGC